MTKYVKTRFVEMQIRILKRCWHKEVMWNNIMPIFFSPPENG